MPVVRPTRGGLEPDTLLPNSLIFLGGLLQYSRDSTQGMCDPRSYIIRSVGSGPAKGEIALAIHLGLGLRSAGWPMQGMVHSRSEARSHHQNPHACFYRGLGWRRREGLTELPDRPSNVS